jgi:hypothetical protein
MPGSSTVIALYSIDLSETMPVISKMNRVLTGLSAKMANNLFVFSGIKTACYALSAELKTINSTI